MKLSRRLVMIAPFLALVFLTSPAHSQKAHGLAYKSIHLMKLTSSNAEASLLQKLAEANKLYVRLGYPNIRYRVWKISGEQSGTFTHIWESGA